MSTPEPIELNLSKSSSLDQLDQIQDKITKNEWVLDDIMFELESDQNEHDGNFDMFLYHL